MVIFYHLETCPKCKVLEMKLKKKGIKYESVMDEEEIYNAVKSRSVPWLNVDGELMDMAAANKWLNSQGGQE